MEDQTPDPLAQFDQALRGLVEFARVLRAHHDAVLAAGFTEQQAFALTLAYQAALQQSFNA